MKIKIAPSRGLYAAGTDITLVQSADLLHFDVMDVSFVPKVRLGE